MKKIILTLAIALFSVANFAQKYAYVDTDYILKNNSTFNDCTRLVRDIKKLDVHFNYNLNGRNVEDGDDIKKELVEILARTVQNKQTLKTCIQMVKEIKKLDFDSDIDASDFDLEKINDIHAKLIIELNQLQVEENRMNDKSLDDRRTIMKQFRKVNNININDHPTDPVLAYPCYEFYPHRTSMLKEGDCLKIGDPIDATAKFGIRINPVSLPKETLSKLQEEMSILGNESIKNKYGQWSSVPKSSQCGTRSTGVKSFSYFVSKEIELLVTDMPELRKLMQSDASAPLKYIGGIPCRRQVTDLKGNFYWHLGADIAHVDSSHTNLSRCSEYRGLLRMLPNGALAIQDNAKFHLGHGKESKGSWFLIDAPVGKWMEMPAQAQSCRHQHVNLKVNGEKRRVETNKSRVTATIVRDKGFPSARKLVKKFIPPVTGRSSILHYFESK